MLLTGNSHGQDRRLKVRSQGLFTELPMVLATSTANLGAVFPLVLTACSHSQAQAASNAAPPPPGVTVAQVISRPLHHWDEFTGELEGVNTVEGQPRVSGFIGSVQLTE